jgi:acyl-CoA thioester hydrolase
MAEPIRTYQGVVYPWQCDHVGHMNVTWYINKFDEATWVFFNHLGLTRPLLAQHHRGMAAVEQRIAYLRELLAGDVVGVETSLLEARPKLVRFVHRMRNAASGETAAVMMQTTLHLDRELRKATALPSDIYARARELVTEVELPWDARK